MIENRTAGLKKRTRRSKLLTNDGPFPLQHNVLQFYSGGGRGELLKRLSQHFQNSEDPVVVYGEHGSGKTMLGMVLSERLKSQLTVLRYSHLLIDSAALIRFLIAGIDESQGIVKTIGTPLAPTQMAVSDINAGVKQIQSYIKEQRTCPQPVLLILDTPANLDHALLALLRRLQEIKVHGYPVFNFLFLLSNNQLESHTSPIDEMVVEKNRYSLGRLSLTDVHDYLQHHMLLYDYNQRDCFTREMSYFIADKSEGVYGAINELVRNAFMLAAMNNCRHLSLSHLRAVGAPPQLQNRTGRRFTRSSLKFAITVTGIVLLYSVLVRA